MHDIARPTIQASSPARMAGTSPSTTQWQICLLHLCYPVSVHHVRARVRAKKIVRAGTAIVATNQPDNAAVLLAHSPFSCPSFAIPQAKLQLGATAKLQRVLPKWLIPKSRSASIWKKEAELIALLEAIGETGSITAAARSMNMSYRRAWLLVDEINNLLNEPAVATATGGARGGGAVLTPAGRKTIQLYHSIEMHTRTAARSEFQAFGKLLRGARGARG